MRTPAKSSTVMVLLAVIALLPEALFDRCGCSMQPVQLVPSLSMLQIFSLTVQPVNL